MYTVRFLLPLERPQSPRNAHLVWKRSYTEVEIACAGAGSSHCLLNTGVWPEAARIQHNAIAGDESSYPQNVFMQRPRNGKSIRM